MCYKPVILIGNGCRNNKALVTYLCDLGVPILTTWMAADLVPEDSPVFCGRPGVVGQRAANIIQQKADELFVFGARLDGGQVAHNLDGFAPKAQKYIFDIDGAELEKLPGPYTTRAPKKIASLMWECHKVDLSTFRGIEISDIDPSWLSWCRALYARFRPELEGVDNPDFVDPYRFVSLLSAAARPDDIFVSGAGACCEAFMQSVKVKAGQRVMPLASNGAMGADIPMAIGAAIGAPGRRVLCITGDGGFAINSPELEVVRRHNLNIKFFVFNNSGYGSIRNMQRARFGRVVGADPESGFTVPYLSNVAQNYGLGYGYAFNNSHAENGIDLVLNDNMPEIFELSVDPSFTPMPKVMSSGALVPDSMEDMTPKLDPQELQEIMNACL